MPNGQVREVIETAGLDGWVEGPGFGFGINPQQLSGVLQAMQAKRKQAAMAFGQSMYGASPMMGGGQQQMMMGGQQQMGGGMGANPMMGGGMIGGQQQMGGGQQMMGGGMGANPMMGGGQMGRQMSGQQQMGGGMMGGGMGGGMMGGGMPNPLYGQPGTPMGMMGAPLRGHARRPPPSLLLPARIAVAPAGAVLITRRSLALSLSLPPSPPPQASTP